jgi:hypothetical protein
MMVLVGTGKAPIPASTEWQGIAAELDAHGCALLKGMLSSGQCVELAASYQNDQLFRSRVVMARHGFGRGEHQYFAYPLPAAVANLRHTLYPPLAAIAKSVE